MLQILTVCAKSDYLFVKYEYLAVEYFPNLWRWGPYLQTCLWEKLSLSKPFPLWYTIRIGLNLRGSMEYSMRAISGSDLGQILPNIWTALLFRIHPRSWNLLKLIQVLVCWWHPEIWKQTFQALLHWMGRPY